MAHSTPLSLPHPPLEQGQPRAARRLLLTLAGLAILLISLLPDVLASEILRVSAPWLTAAKLAILAVLLLVSLAWAPARPLWRFFAVMLAFYLLVEIANRITAAPLWQSWFPQGAAAPFPRSMLGVQLSRLVISCLLIAVLRLVGLRRQDFFLTPGHLRAPIRPVRWLGFPKPDPWTRFGGQWSVYIPLGTLAFLILAARPSLTQVQHTLPVLPILLILAAINAFSEEIWYRSAVLSTLEKPLGGRAAIWLAAVFFGIGHYYGVPYGILGVLMATFLGWIMGKAMLETRGFFWSWWIHFLQDVAIFFFLAMGSITPGG